MNIPNVNHFVHAYKLAPWRVQRQWIGNFLLVVVAMAMVAALYLDVTARAAIAGRQIQDLTSQISAVEHSSADLQTQLATLTSTGVMEQKASDMGYHPVEQAQVEYLIVPGYVAPEPEILSSAPQPGLSAPTIPPEYTQSLLDWLDQKIQNLGENQ
ncbi:MAG TPA: hypothetical protein VMT73_14110 [Anaerolineales bacterium]|nr:hypothetical protein [Anaerolineales bacterium]